MPTIQVYPHLSPRVIEVLDPAEEITVQEIVDLIRAWEDDEINMVYELLIDAAGKEPLGGDVYVGITATLQNAQLRFSSRPNEIETGTVTTGDASGKTLHDTSGQFETNLVYPGCTVVNNTTTAMETVTNVVSEIELEHFSLGGGSRNDWQVGDSYSIYPNVQCKITGGNLVAVDENGDEISSILQSPNVQIIRSSSSSATLVDQVAIRTAIFDSVVYVDSINGLSGTDFPLGTLEQPVDNWDDACAIAAVYNIRTIRFLEDYVFDAADVLDDWRIEGINHHVDLTFTSGVSTNRVAIHNCRIGGALSGSEVGVEDCRVNNLTGFSGEMFRCILSGNVTLTGATKIQINQCWSGVPGLGTPTIDMGGSGRGLSVRQYSGGIKLINKTGADSVSLDFVSGQVILDGTVANGTIVVRGITMVTDDSGVGCTVNREAQVQTTPISYIIEV
jgi:hypothetical protein